MLQNYTHAHFTLIKEINTHVKRIEATNLRESKGPMERVGERKRREEDNVIIFYLKNTF